MYFHIHLNEIMNTLQICQIIILQVNTYTKV